MGEELVNICLRTSIPDVHVDAIPMRALTWQEIVTCNYDVRRRLFRGGLQKLTSETCVSQHPELVYMELFETTCKDVDAKHDFPVRI
jgi:hypothetical protein